MILENIIANTQKELAARIRLKPLASLELLARKTPKGKHLFLNALTARENTVRLICELKRKSPAAGIIRKKFAIKRLVMQFERGGACAISVLTDHKYFGGSKKILSHVRKITSLPLLRKDFIIESYQVYESMLIGADAFLLIASALDQKTLTSLVKLGQRLGLDPLVEIRTRQELRKAIASGTNIIGINNRNLNTMKVNTKFALSLIPHIPKNKVVVIESGIENFRDIAPYLEKNVRNFLVGTAVMKAKNIQKKLAQLRGDNEQGTL